MLCADIMASGRIRSTRRLRTWLVEQVNSGLYPGLQWDDAAKTMFRIPWKHAGKQDFRSDEDAAIFKAWAVFKGKLSHAAHADPASWKTRLRCALNKSPEFSEVNERSQLDISEPYKVYRLVPLEEQGVSTTGVKKAERASKRRTRKTMPASEDEDETAAKQIKQENEIPPVDITTLQWAVNGLQPDDDPEATDLLKDLSPLNEIRLNLTIDTGPPLGDMPSLVISIFYVGREVLKREVYGKDVRIAYFPTQSRLPLPSSFTERIALPEPPANLLPTQQLQAFSNLLPFLEKGILVATTKMGILAQRFCQGRVFWSGPHTAEPGPRKLERTNKPVLLFNQQRYQQELDKFQKDGGTPPLSGVTLCFGEELTDISNLSSKLIIIQISLPWATQQVQHAQSMQDSLAFFQNMANQSPLGEVTLNLVSI